MARVRVALDGAAIDAIVGPAANRRKRLLIADMDSTIVTGETLDELADFAGLKDRIAAITARAMNGELDFKAALRERVAMLQRAAGRRAGAHLAARASHRRRARTGGDDARARRLYRAGVGRLHASSPAASPRCAASTCIGRTHCSTTAATLTGLVGEPILDRDTKLATLNALAAERGLARSATLAVGDGANDLDMLRAAGLGVAFHAKPIVAAAAQARVDHADLRALLFAQGYRAEEIVTP